MQTNNLVQGSPEWLAHRAKYFNASEAPIMMGRSPFMSRNDLLKMKASGISPDTSSFQEKIFAKGHATEATAMAMAEHILEVELYPVSGTTEEFDDLPLAASLDGTNMMETVVWEHKQWNKELVELVKQDIIPNTHTPQLEQQLMVSGAGACLFMVSDGTEKNMVHTWYRQDPVLRQEIIDGWKLFAKDLSTYVPEQIEEKPTAKVVPKALPTPDIVIKGMVTRSNLPTIKSYVESYIESIKEDLQTDQDFADADKVVKFLSESESKISVVKDAAIAQTADIEDVLLTLDDLREQLRTKRLALEKLVSNEKTRIKEEAIRKRIDQIDAYMNEKEELIGIPGILGHNREYVDLGGAAKNKRTMKSLNDSLDTALANGKLAVNKVADVMLANNKTYEDLASDHIYLFSDLVQILSKQPDDFKLLVESRIREHEAEKAAEVIDHAAVQTPEPEPSDAVEATPVQEDDDDPPQLIRKTINVDPNPHENPMIGGGDPEKALTAIRGAIEAKTYLDDPVIATELALAAEHWADRILHLSNSDTGAAA